ncbi:MAG: hypothetical protein SFW36_05485, partial [Leptolyngbyaceae cyanobacterium bins.59]|nr:hypothetical protein [Leptolyngbyaceae cyanobacterium bins.59]
MASPTMKGGKNQFQQVLPVRLRLPLAVRRVGAWTVEVTLVTVSAFVPYWLGSQVDAQFKGEKVPVNLVLAKTEETIAQVLALPPTEGSRRVAP